MALVPENQVSAKIASTPASGVEVAAAARLFAEVAELIGAPAPSARERVAIAGPMYLTGVSTTEARAHDGARLGLLAQPGNSVLLDVDAGYYDVFGADNAFYGLGAKVDPTPEREAAAVQKWATWVLTEVAKRADRCLFVTVPDVLNWLTLDNGKRVPVGDAEATIARYHELAGFVRAAGLPAALVAQDGLRLEGDELVAGAERLAWEDVDVIFVGGSDAYKEGPEAAALCREAQRRGKWVHVGRVNSWRRLDLVRDYADSVDGTFLGFGPSANWPRLAKWLTRLDDFAAELPLSA